jgi:tetratricopeptide (TPR) repeat protein
MTKYRIRLPNGRVIGPFEKQQLFELKTKGHIKGIEEAQIFPTGNWEPIAHSDFYSEMMDENRTVFQSSHETREETFVIDLEKLRNQKQEKELEAFDHGTIVPIEQLTETIRISQAVPSKVKIEAPPEALPPELAELATSATSSENGFSLELDEHDKTIINPVAQQEIEKMRRLERQAEAKKLAEEEKKKRVEEEEKNKQLAIIKENEVVSSNDSTQVIKIDKKDLLENALIAEDEIDRELRIEKKRIAKEEAEARRDDEEDEDSDEENPKKKNKIILIVAALAIAYALLFPEEKPKAPAFQHLEPQIVFPIPFDQADPLKSKAEFKRGLEAFDRGTYPSIIKAGLNFKASYENDLENIAALNFMVRAYSEELKNSNEKLSDSQTVFNVIQSKRPFLLQDANGAIGLNQFYTAINKYDAAIDVVQKYLKLHPKEVTQDLFAVYLRSLLKQGKVDLATQFYKALLKAPEKNRYTYAALIEYELLNQETDKAMEYVSDAIKKNPKLTSFYLMKAELLLKEKKFDEVVPFVKKAEELNLDYNNINRAKLFEIKGLVYAFKGKPKEATAYLTKSLKLNDSVELRMKLADLATSEGNSSETDKLINESKAIKFLMQAKDFYEKRNYELAMSSAAKASDSLPGHIPSELFLAKVQLKLGLAQQGLKTMDELVNRYPEDKEINFGLIEAYIDTYKFNDAKNRIQIVAATEHKATWEYASVNAKLFLKMGDSLQAMSWLKNSISANPLNDADIFLLSELLQKRGNFDNARMLLNKCIELDPLNPDYRIAYARLIYETQDDQAAIGYLVGLKDEFGENPKVMSEIAILYYRSGKVKDYEDVRAKLEKLHSSDKALYEFLIKAALLDERNAEIPGLVEKLLTIEPGDLEAMMTAGRVLFEDGKLVDSAKWFKRVQHKLPSYPKVLYYIAKIDFLSGDLDGAMKKIQEDIKENGENDNDLVFMAQIHAAKEEFVEAENLYKRAQKLNPRSYDAIVGLADLSTKRNNHDLALDLYKRAMKLKSDEAIVHKKIGDVYRQLGQGTLAIEAYKLYLEMDPESPHKSNLEAYINLMK